MITFITALFLFAFMFIFAFFVRVLAMPGTDK